LDELICGLQIGDNVVWQIDDIEDYRHFVEPFVRKSIAEGRQIVYIRFGDHAPLVKPGNNITIYELDAREGFEAFSTKLHKVIEEKGEGVYYVFDCLTDLLKAWATDLMIGNFFKITCPYLFVLNTIAYFSIIRNRHSFLTIARIRETTQLLIDIYRDKGKRFIHPLKVWSRYTPTMFLPHLEEGDKFIPLTGSADVARLFSDMGQRSASSTKQNLDYWDQLFLKAEELMRKRGAGEKQKALVERLSKILMTRDERFLGLVEQYFDLEDLVRIKSRLIGTGFLGGKAVGMLLARKILEKSPKVDWSQLLEPHDSFYIGSDVFYTYIVQNGWWKLRMKQKTKEGYFKVASEMKSLLLKGEFPREIREQFEKMMESFGQSPVIVRSSSLLEDGFGNAFAGKYESVFCANQGSPEERYEQFAQAVRRIYASTMNVDALAYRLQRGLDQHDEQMALLVQRVSGAYHKHCFFPDVGGVGISFNTFVWKEDMDPKAGMLRVVFGLGTRAVNRVERDYPRIVALDEPLLKPHSGMEETKRFSQHYVDLINVRERKFETQPLDKVANDNPAMTGFDRLAVVDFGDSDESSAGGRARGETKHWVLTFDSLLSDKTFTGAMSRMMKTLERAYAYPVEIEFTVNFMRDGNYQINLLQCRPLQAKGLGKKVDIPKRLDPKKVFFSSKGGFLGGSILQPIRRLIYVDPKGYSELSLSSKYDIARLVGALNKQVEDRNLLPTFLLGPGRWGTKMPSLGVPVSFSEINNITALGELSFAGAQCVPELSFGTHFFQDLMESSIFYVAIFTESKDVLFHPGKILDCPNALKKLAPEYAKYSKVVTVAELETQKVRLMADILTQRVVLFS